MKKTVRLIALLLFALCLTSCIASTKTNEIISENIPSENNTKPEQSSDVHNENGSGQNESDKNDVATQMFDISLYFPDNDALFLHKEIRTVEVAENESIEMVILRELFKGPESDELAPSLTGEDLVIAAETTDEGTCVVDFKSDFITLNTGGSTRETFAIASIVNSLCELDDVNTVIFTVENKSNIEFGHFIIDSAMEPMTDLVKDE